MQKLLLYTDEETEALEVMSPSWTSDEHGGCSHPWFVFLENSLQWHSDTGTDFTYQQNGFPELSAHESAWGMGFLPGLGLGAEPRAQLSA